MSSVPVLELKNVSKIFDAGTGKEIQAVRKISFSIAEGESVGIVGESGCGKSTLTRMITGLTDVSDGQILLDGEDITGYSRRQMRKVYQKVQLVFQDPYSVFSPRMRVGTFLEEGLTFMKIMSRKEAAREAVRLMEMVELSPELLDRLPHQLSGGQLQRVAIARVLSVKPRLLILDEATSALDVSVQKQVLELLKRLKQELGLTCLVIGHDLAVVQDLTDRMEVMYAGEVVESLPADSLLSKASHEYTKKLLASVYSI